MKNDPKHWEILSSKVVIEDYPWMRLHQQRLALPHGGFIDPFWVVEHPDWASVLAVTKDEKILLIRQYRHGVQSVDWELPAGIIDAGETPLQAAQRELLEETGYSGGKWAIYTKSTANPSTHSNVNHCFFAEGVEKIRDQQLEKNEEITVHELSKSDLRRIVEAHEIKQAMHLGACWRYLAL